MKKAPNCIHQFPGEPNCQPAFRNYYVCPYDSTTWSHDWSAMCNDRCPTCNKEIEPRDSVEVARCACLYLEDVLTR